MHRAVTNVSASWDIVGAFQQQDVAIGITHHGGPEAAAERHDARRDEADAIVFEYLHLPLEVVGAQREMGMNDMVRRP
jgi:hypothetical protein